MVTVFENIYSDQPFYTTVDKALARIKDGRSAGKINEIRKALDKEKADALKRQLPSVCFSGKFSKRTDDAILEHSGFIVLDFDEVEDIGSRMAEICSQEFVYAAWLSPRGNGLKALARIADGTKHREHFEALREVFPDADRSGVNQSRVCYESYDPHLYLNPKAKKFAKVKTVEKIEVRETLEEQKVFENLLKWLSNKNNAFVKGERNIFIFKLASACCRFGISEESAGNLILTEYPASSDFSSKECRKAIQSAYRANRGKQATASFEREILVDKVTRKEVEIDEDFFDTSVKPKDVIYGADVKSEALKIYKDGYENLSGLGIPTLDELFKERKGEITLLTGHGNYGKSQYKKWRQIFRAILYGQKFATFPPEDYPIHNFYHDLVEILLGCDCTPRNPARPKIQVYNAAYDFVSRHFFYIYPTSFAPTPEYVKERFLELIIKESVDECDVDPFNQMTNDYGKSGGRSDKYLETVLADFGRFGQVNNVHMTIVAHPKGMALGKDGNYPCPNVYDVADGAMWNNKMDNIIIYHRPFMQTNPEDPTCEVHSKKIRNQKIVGKKGFLVFNYMRKTRRFEVDGVDYMDKALKSQGIIFN